MTNWIIRLILGVVLVFSSALSGMAREAISTESQPDFFVAGEVCEDSSKQALLVFSDDGMLPSFSVEEQSESSVESETEQKRNQKRASSPEKFLSKCRLINFLSLEALAKGVARHPLTQDARQERTEMIRFLQQAALVC